MASRGEGVEVLAAAVLDREASVTLSLGRNAGRPGKASDQAGTTVNHQASPRHLRPSRAERNPPSKSASCTAFDVALTAPRKATIAKAWKTKGNPKRERGIL